MLGQCEAKPLVASHSLSKYWADCYADLAVSSSVVAETITSTRCTEPLTHGGTARLSGPE